MSGWKKIVGDLAPTIGLALGGPFGGIAGKFLKSKLLGDENASDLQLEEAIENATPEQLLTIRQLDYQFKTDMAKLGIREEELRVADRANARELYKVDKRPQIVLSAIYTVGYFLLLYGLLTGYLVIPDDNKGLIAGLIGVLTGAQVQILNFWFGSSSGSKDKTAPV